jgi:hypothetical protein
MYKIIPQPLTTADSQEIEASTSMYPEVQFVVGDDTTTTSLAGPAGMEEISSENESNFYQKIELK